VKQRDTRRLKGQQRWNSWDALEDHCLRPQKTWTCFRRTWSK